ncbi:hypothetical protein [Ilumatobacter coccineus]|uniref:Uncharacterized protein n=1 Tax=Ilumatobacter coccineus (strain NBRC 103263 / KCTC 29153 / YM16-304) TaxID=1313172 RepID=A0A6C7ECI9_ILUCY|nr:hypothetical protein [Ilumatobacter coccineus]BAN02889.1 hypothetical protein YM304_25750 [Ilumatobacter coccineus YM16-304]
MADNDPLAEMFNLFAAPLAGTIRSFDQFRKGVDEFLRGVENFNRTMESLNETAERINTLLAEVEEPIKAAVPQVTRTVKAADEMMQVVAGPAMAVAPGLMKLSDTLNNPAFQQMPNQLGQMTELLGEVTTRLAPLGHLAESAGGLFGGFKIPGFGGPAAPKPPAGDAPVPPSEPAAAPQPAKPAAKKPAAKKTAAKKAPAKKRAPKKAAARKKSS